MCKTKKLSKTLSKQNWERGMYSSWVSRLSWAKLFDLVRKKLTNFYSEACIPLTGTLSELLEAVLF